MNETSNLTTDDIRLRDPLSEVTRKERRVLLAVSALGIVIVKTGLVPSKVTALGIEFSHADQQALILALAAVVGYFLLAFIIYATSDLTAWRVAFGHARVLEEIEWEQRRRRPVDADQEILIRSTASEVWWSRAPKPMSFVRAVFEFGLPVIIGVYAVVLLLTASPPPPPTSKPVNRLHVYSQNETYWSMVGVRPAGVGHPRFDGLRWWPLSAVSTREDHRHEAEVAEFVTQPLQNFHPAFSEAAQQEHAFLSDGVDDVANILVIQHEIDELRDLDIVDRDLWIG